MITIFICYQKQEFAASRIALAQGRSGGMKAIEASRLEKQKSKRPDQKIGPGA
jgi:hypothetical protein